MNNNLPCIAITSGEPAGIGPELCLMLAKQHQTTAKVVIIGDMEMLASRARMLNLDISLQPYQPGANSNTSLQVMHTPTQNKVVAGKLDTANSRYVLNTLDMAIQGCLDRTFNAMVTAPVHKGIINDTGIAFTGHTEYLAEQTNTTQVVMMLVGGGLHVALATTHLPLAKVSSAITRTSLETTIRILHADLVTKFGLAQPRILVSGLNPHAGEGGHLGEEEITIINPVLNKLRIEGMELIGALPADTLFAQHHLDQADAVLAMYHDQGLPVLKYASFGKGVNITLGLPIIRTSVDHGTALDLAGTGNINAGSMAAAIELAIDLANNNKLSPEHHAPSS